MVHGRRKNSFWPGAASDTNRSHGVDFCFLRNNVMPRAQRSGDHRPIALLAWKCREMKIMRCGFCRTGQRSISGHWWHHPVVNNWNIAFRNYFWHGVLLLGVLEPSCKNAPGRAVTPASLRNTCCN
jgi:hypothetical protein